MSKYLKTFFSEVICTKAKILPQCFLIFCTYISNIFYYICALIIALLRSRFKTLTPTQMIHVMKMHRIMGCVRSKLHICKNMKNVVYIISFV